MDVVQGQEETEDFPGMASIGVDTRDPSMPAPGASTKLCYCYSCNREEPAAECLDLELRCLRCGGTCVEVLEEVETSSPPAPGASSGNLYMAVPQAPPQLQPTQSTSAASDAQTQQEPPSSAPAPHVRRPRRETTRRRLQGPIGARTRLGEGAHHIGVICDGCRASSFTGVRYRCLRCRDYDLCASCHARRSVLHPSHPFEAIRTPRSTVPALVADFMAQSATRTVVAIFEIGLEGDTEARSGLDDSRVAWWLADEGRLVSVDHVAVEDPTWSCPICSEGLEAEASNGWVVQICTGKGVSIEGASGEDAAEGSPPSPGAAADTTAGATTTGGTPEALGHVYHEACLRKWLLKRNSCPVCRRTPIVPEPEGGSRTPGGIVI